MQYPKNVQKLIQLLSKLPGVGKRTAERYAFDMLINWSSNEIIELEHNLNTLKTEATFCSACGVLTEATQNPCIFCTDTCRDHSKFCVVASPKDVFSLEGISEYSGVYHVLPALLSPLDGRGEEILNLSNLLKRVQENSVREIIFAIDSSVEGDATCLYLKQALESMPIAFYRLAFGIPVGSSLEYVDGGTLARAFCGRSQF